MQNPFVLLGVENSASTEQIRAAYHKRVKLCHPDSKQDELARQSAQDSLIQLNLAYAEAMRQANFRESSNVVITDAKVKAAKLMERGQYDGALRMLNKAADRDAEWFSLQGNILLKKGEAEAAHACFRTAVRMEPEKTQYREFALNAAVQMRKQKTFRGRMSGWARTIASRMTL